MPPTVRIILQARTTSARLPRKVLLPISGLPTVILAAKRAARKGSSVVIATSDDRSDDSIAITGEAYSFPVYRGSLNDVYSRFIGASQNLEDKDIVVRLTADNVFPDADFIEQIVQQLLATGASYVAPQWPQDGWPYGLSAEAFRIGALRQRAPQSVDDAEHVTPALRRASPSPAMSSGISLGHLRATIDTADDYGLIKSVFAAVSDPIQVGWRELCEVLDKLPRQRISWRAHTDVVEPQLTLGGAQLGMKYGIANSSGMLNQSDVSRIVHRAIDHGILQIDTARLYGESEQRVGAALAERGQRDVTVITKLPEILEQDPTSATAAADAHIDASRRALRRDRLDALLLHRAKTFEVANGAVWQRLLERKAAGGIGRLGISVQSPEELALALEIPDVELVQLPFNILDWRWSSKLAGNSRIGVHARSALLQGLLAGAPEAIWPKVKGVNVPEVLAILDKLVKRLGRYDLRDLAFAFVRAQPGIHSLVVGCETDQQLAANIETFTRPPLDSDGCALVRSMLPAVPAELLDPAAWPRLQ